MLCSHKTSGPSLCKLMTSLLFGPGSAYFHNTWNSMSSNHSHRFYAWTIHSYTQYLYNIPYCGNVYRLCMNRIFLSLCSMFNVQCSSSNKPTELLNYSSYLSPVSHRYLLDARCKIVQNLHTSLPGNGCYLLHRIIWLRLESPNRLLTVRMMSSEAAICATATALACALRFWSLRKEEINKKKDGGTPFLPAKSLSLKDMIVIGNTFNNIRNFRYDLHIRWINGRLTCIPRLFLTRHVESDVGEVLFRPIWSWSPR